MPASSDLSDAIKQNDIGDDHLHYTSPAAA